MSMQPVSPEQIESTRNTGARLRAEVGQRLVAVTQARAAAFMDTSASTVSRAVEDLDKACHLLAALGLQVAPLDAVVVSREDMQALERMAYKYLQNRIESDRGRY
jgi:hypothetical protein